MMLQDKDKWRAVLKVIAAIAAALLGILGGEAANGYLSL